MNTQALFQNIVDVIEEGQLKLGYRAESIRLYYPLDSLNRFLGTQQDAEGMMKALVALCAQYAGRLGDIAVSRRGKRFCLTVPPEGAAYVHAHTDEDGFLARFIAMMARHGTRMEEVIALFRSCSPCVQVAEMRNGEFDYLIRFEDGEPDAYYYLITDEGCHLTYHRFTREDYDAFGF